MSTVDSPQAQRESTPVLSDVLAARTRERADRARAKGKRAKEASRLRLLAYKHECKLARARKHYAKRARVACA